jgi:uridine kinase
MSIDEIVQTITSRHGPRLALIAIEGYGGSGKTTFANQFRNALGSAFVVNIDDFIVKDRITKPSWDKGGFDRKRLEQQVLIPATTGQRVSYQALIWETNTLSEPKVVPSVDYLIVEGISSYHPDIALYYDYKIWVDTPIDVAKARGKARDAGNENADKWDMWAENDLMYQHQYHPEQNADFVVTNG